MAVVSHYDIQPVIDIFGACTGAIWAAVARRHRSRRRRRAPRAAARLTIIVRGQIQTMRSSYGGLLGGLAFAIVLVYLLIVVNFQSWLDPFIIIAALPAALAGIAGCSFVTRTTLSVPALTGAIMCMGVATANSILVVSFANQRMQAGSDAARAPRWRPASRAAAPCS